MFDLNCRHVTGFLEQLYTLDDNIKFTYEVEETGSITFLDTKIHVLEDSSTKCTVDRKKLNTDQHLKFQSNQHKKSVLRTLMYRADNSITTELVKKLKQLT